MRLILVLMVAFLGPLREFCSNRNVLDGKIVDLKRCKEVIQDVFLRFFTYMFLRNLLRCFRLL